MKRMPVMLLAFTFLVPLVIPSGASAGSGTFTDIAGNTHAEAIQAIADADITKGCTATTYCPADLVTRAQMASFLARAFELPPATRDYFRDGTGSVHEDNINRIAEEGITLGVSPGIYDPGGQVTRAQMASFLARALGLDPVSGNRFSDVDGTHAGNINAIAEEGITLGCDAAGTRYCPTDPVRRDQMASFLARALDLIDTEVLDRPAIGSQPRAGENWELLGCTNESGTCSYSPGGWVRLETRGSLISACQIWDYSVIPHRCLYPGGAFGVTDPSGRPGIPGQDTYTAGVFRHDTDTGRLASITYQFPLHPTAPRGLWTGRLCDATSYSTDCRELLTVYFEVGN